MKTKEIINELRAARDEAVKQSKSYQKVASLYNQLIKEAKDSNSKKPSNV